MNEIYLLLHAVLDKLSYSNLQFNYIPALHRAKTFKFECKKGRYKECSVKQRNLALWNAGV